MRRCVVCGIVLDGMRADAESCSAACRTQAWRLRRLLAGKPVGRYETLADRMAAYGRSRRPSRHRNAA